MMRHRHPADAGPPWPSAVDAISLRSPGGRPETRHAPALGVHTAAGTARGFHDRPLVGGRRLQRMESRRERRLGGSIDGMEPTAPEAQTPVVDADEQLSQAVEAVLVTLDRPIRVEKLADGLGLGVEGGADRVRSAVDALNRDYDRSGRAFRIEFVSGGLRLMTRESMEAILTAFHGSRAQSRLSRAAVETLAVIAYRQPITRASLEAIRGVACGDVLRTLVERRLVTVRGRAEELGRPMLYGTTRDFLEAFGLASIKDLPSPEELTGTEGV